MLTGDKKAVRPPIVDPAERDRILQSVLDHYAATTIRAILKRHQLKVPSQVPKVEAIQLLKARFQQLGEQRIWETLSPQELAALHLTRCRPEMPAGQLLLDLARAGQHSRDELLIGLLENGYLLASSNLNLGVVDLSDPARLIGLQVLVNPWLDIPDQLPPPLPIVLPPVPSGLELQLYNWDPHTLHQAMRRFLNLVRRKAFKVNTRGQLYAASYTTLLQESGLTSYLLPLDLVLMLAGSAGWIGASPQRILEVTDKAAAADAPPQQFTAELVKVVLGPFLWLDDIQGGDAVAIHELYSGQAVTWDGPFNRGPTYPARALIVDLLTQLAPSSWVSLDAFTDLVLDRDPRLLLHGSFQVDVGLVAALGALRVTPLHLHRQRNAVAAVIARTLLVLGLVEVATVTGDLPQFSYPTSDQRRWLALRLAGEPAADRFGNQRGVYQPEPTGVYFRLTPLGRAVLLGEGYLEAATPSAPSLTIGADFEVYALREDLPASLQLELDSFLARRSGHITDPMLRFKIEKEAWIAALRTGRTADSLLAILQSHAKTGIPSNVARTLDDWSRSFGAVTLWLSGDLLEFETAKLRDAFVAKHSGARAIGECFALAERASRAGQVIDYSQAPARVLTWSDPHTFRQQQPSGDLLLRGELEAIAERTGVDTWRLTPESVQRSRLDAGEILDCLGSRSIQRMPYATRLSVRGWKGVFPPIATAQLLVIRVDDPYLQELFTTDSTLRRCFLGRLSNDCLVLDPDRVDELKAILNGWGVLLGGRLDIQPLK